jgi:hypothetical protein
MSGPGASGTPGAPFPGKTRVGTSTEFTAGAGGGVGFSSGSLVLSGGGETPWAGFGVPTTTQFPDGSWIKCAVSLVGIIPKPRAASANSGADSASSTSRWSASFCCCNSRFCWRALPSW